METKRADVRKITLSAMLVALSVVIILLMPIKLTNIFWTGTLASHVPQMISVFLGPLSAAAVAIGSAVTFFFTYNIMVAFRALSHIFFSLAAWALLRRGVNRYVALISVGPIHALAEVLIVFAFTPSTPMDILWLSTGLSTLIHHFVDCAIAFPIIETLQRTRLVSFIGFSKKNKSI